MAEEFPTILITGGTDGLGRATAVLLAQRGYRVFAAGRHPGRRAEIDRLAREQNLPLESAEMDVTDDASVERAVGEIERKAGPVEILVNGAGIAIVAALEEITLADLRKQFETNFFGAVRVTQRVLPTMRQLGRGRIINVSSVSGKFTTPLFGPYSSSKFALEAASDALRLELYPFGIYVVLIEPGYIPTSMNRTAAELSSAYSQGAERSPYQRIYERFLSQWKKRTGAGKVRSKPEDCARVVLRAVEETPPRTRYSVTRDGWLALRMRRLLSDRAFDRIIIRRMGLKELRAALEKERRA